MTPQPQEQEPRRWTIWQFGGPGQEGIINGPSIPDQRDVEVVEASAYERVKEERDAQRDYANEAWAWLEDALDALGAKTVFHIKDRGAELERLRGALREIAERDWTQPPDLMPDEMARAALNPPPSQPRED